MGQPSPPYLLAKKMQGQPVGVGTKDPLGRQGYGLRQVGTLPMSLI